MKQVLIKSDDSVFDGLFPNSFCQTFMRIAYRVNKRGDIVEFEVPVIEASDHPDRMAAITGALKLGGSKLNPGDWVWFGLYDKRDSKSKPAIRGREEDCYSRMYRRRVIGSKFYCEVDGEKWYIVRAK